MADIRLQVSGRSNPVVAFNDAALATLPASGAAALSGALGNDDATNEFDLFADLELIFKYDVAPTAGGLIELYMALSIDSTTYEDATAHATPGSVVRPRNYIDAFAVRAVTTVQRQIIPFVRLPPRDFKVMLVNGASQALGAAGNGMALNAYCYRLRG